MKLLKNMMLSAAALAFTSFGAVAGTWIDKDGKSAAVVNDGILSIYSMSDFYYFDELFSDVRDGSKIRICIGFDDGTGTASDCIGHFIASAGFYNEGKTRALHFNIEAFGFIFHAFENFLIEGRTMKLSIDNNDLYSAYYLNKKFKLTDGTRRILELQD